jgi:hypothetical protein
LRQTDVTRATRALKAAGLDILTTEITPDGTVRLFHSGPAKSQNIDPFDNWKATKRAY